MNKINIIFPHQLYKDSPLIQNGNPIYLVEEYLFFEQYKFHKQKLAFHRASMKCYAEYLKDHGANVNYIDSSEEISDIRAFINQLIDGTVEEVHVIDPTDDWLEQRLDVISQKSKLVIHQSPQFLNARSDNEKFFRADKKSFFQTTFYKQQRKKRNILVDGAGEPMGGKWTFDVDNRKKYPKGKVPPAIHFPKSSKYWSEAVDYVEQNFSNNPGQLSTTRWYPINHQEAESWLDQFFEYRFYAFGDYEDAIVKEYSILHHSLLSPLINAGLLTPDYVVGRALAYAEEHQIPINSTEGFVRQIIGWREFIRGMYECKGRYSRTRNYWNFKRKIPQPFYTGDTGIAPVDDAIKKVLESGYCHHIERLMVLGSFMVLCEFDPDEVYRWFMELFIDAYDWVMVPNVYGMSQFADGGTFATKPYISGSNYIRKMSNYPKGEWQATWDGLFWRFMDTHRSTFRANPRMGMLLGSLDRMDTQKREGHFKNADAFLATL